MKDKMVDRNGKELRAGDKISLFSIGGNALVSRVVSEPPTDVVWYGGSWTKSEYVEKIESPVLDFVGHEIKVGDTVLHLGFHTKGKVRTVGVELSISLQTAGETRYWSADRVVVLPS